MGIRLQLLLFIASLISLIMMIVLAKQNKINIRYSIVWIILFLCLLLSSIFPSTIYYLSNLTGFLTPVNFVFLLVIFIALCLIYYLFIQLSKHKQEINNLTYKVAKLEKLIDDKGDKNV